MATPNKYVQTNTLYIAGAGTIVGATSISLTTFTDIYGNVLSMTDFGTTGYITLEPDTSNEEAAIFTGVTANANGTYTLTGLSTAIAKSPYTTTSGLVRSHGGGQKVVVTDNVAFWNTFANKANDEVITGTWTFSNAPISPGNPSATATVPGIATLKLNNYAVDTGTANVYTIAPSPAITSYVTGQLFTFSAINTNTGASTLNINGLGVKTIKKNVTTDVVAGDIVSGAIVVVEYDGTNFQLISNPSTLFSVSSNPIVHQYTPGATFGDSTTTFNIINSTGTTYRYTYTTGTNPSINSGTLPIGSVIMISNTSFASANQGLFAVTGIGSNFFEVTNASGVTESAKTISNNGVIFLGSSYSKPSNLKYIEIEIVGGGQGSGAVGSGQGQTSGGNSGGYSRKIITASSLGATEYYAVGPQNPTVLTGGGGNTQFSITTPIIAGGATTAGGIATGGDLNVSGILGGIGFGSSTIGWFGGAGASTPLGVGGLPTGTAGQPGSGYGSGASGAGFTTGTSGRSGQPGTIFLIEHF